MSLREARENVRRIGAKAEYIRYAARPPYPEEVPPERAAQVNGWLTLHGTLRELHDQARLMAIWEIRSTQWTGGDVPRWPESLDLLLWNMVVAFGVAVARESTIGVLRERVERQVTLDRDDLERYQDILYREPFTVDLRRLPEARARVLDVVTRSLGGREPEAVTDRILDTLANTVRLWPGQMSR